MGAMVRCGIGVVLDDLAKAKGFDDVDSYLASCGFTFSMAAEYSEADLDDAYEDYLDEFLYEYAYEHLPRKYGTPQIFTYACAPESRSYGVFADAENIWKEHVGFDKAEEVLHAEFGEDAEIRWFALAEW